jgi:hypothetical protein
MVNLLKSILTGLAVAPLVSAQVYQMVGGLDPNTSIIGNYYN